MSLLAMLAAAAASEPPICTDRPTKANALCTVPQGRFQLESATFDWTRTEAGGSKTQSLVLGATSFKYGLSERSDLQVIVAPLVRIESDGDSVSGFGDVTIRYKHRLTSDDAKLQVAVIPFVKIPTAKHAIGNGKVEGGVAVPLSLSAGKATVTFGPEADLLADSDGSGRHIAIVNLANVALPVAPRLTAIGELWSNINFDSGDTSKQASADVALAFAVSNNVQLDAGANLGLTRETADVELYAGISARF